MSTRTRNTIGAEIKKELGAKFPGIKFSVRYSSYSGGDSVDISWLYGPTTDEVRTITDLYQGGHFNGMEDIYEYSEPQQIIDNKGELRVRPTAKYVHVSRSYSTDYSTSEAENLIAQFICERQNIEHEGEPIHASKYVNGSYRRVSDEVYKALSRTSFKTSNPTITGVGYIGGDYALAYTETVNGETHEVTVNDLLITDYKHELEYYKNWLKEETKKKEEFSKLYYDLRNQVEQEKKDRLKPTLLNVEDQKIFVTDGQYAHMNKNDNLQTYIQEVATGDYSTEETKITEVIYTTDEGYEFLKENLLTDFDYLKGKGGTNSHYKLPEEYENASYFNWPHEVQEAFKKQAYREGVLVYHPTKDLFIIDPQGYSYARYVALIPGETQTKLRTFIENL